MAALLTRSLVASVVSPLLNLSRVVAKPRSFSACLLGTLRGASPRPEARWLPWGRPQQPLLQQPAQGFKTKGTLRKRCRDCYLVKRRGRWFIYCKTNPRHKQRQM